MVIECGINGDASNYFLLYITTLCDEDVSKTYNENQSLFLEIYKHLKYCEICEDYYSAFKRAILAKDYKDYVRKFSTDWVKKSFKLIREIFSEEQLRLIRQNEKYLESLLN